MGISKYFFSLKAVSAHAVGPWEVLSWSRENLALSRWDGNLGLKVLPPPPDLGLPASLTPPKGTGYMFPCGPTAPNFSQFEHSLLCHFGVTGFLARLEVLNGFEELRKAVDVVPQKNVQPTKRPCLVCKAAVYNVLGRVWGTQADGSYGLRMPSA